MADLTALWDSFQLDPFVSRRECQDTLRSTPEGTFMLRLSHTKQRALVICYKETSLSSAPAIKHFLLTRQAFVKLQFVYTQHVLQVHVMAVMIMR